MLSIIQTQSWTSYGLPLVITMVLCNNYSQNQNNIFSATEQYLSDFSENWEERGDGPRAGREVNLSTICL